MYSETFNCFYEDNRKKMRENTSEHPKHKLGWWIVSFCGWPWSWCHLSWEPFFCRKCHKLDNENKSTTDGFYLLVVFNLVPPLLWEPRQLLWSSDFLFLCLKKTLKKWKYIWKIAKCDKNNLEFSKVDRNNWYGYYCWVSVNAYGKLAKEINNTIIIIVYRNYRFSGIIAYRELLVVNWQEKLFTLLSQNCHKLV